jgi:D-alanine transaminase
MPELAFVNGTFSAINEAFVPIEDRGYQFGDAIYEFLATYSGVVYALEEHLDRLDRSLKILSYPPIDRAKLKRDIAELLKRSGFLRAGIYIQISRGVAPRNHAYPKSAQPQIVMTIREVVDIPESVRKAGIQAITVEDIRWGRCDAKTVQLLPNTMAKQKALDAGAQDAILVGSDGVVREGTSSNLFMAKNGELWTHPLTEKILPGITRLLLLGFCREEAIKVHEEHFQKTSLMAADEVFLSGTVTEVLSIVEIDSHKIGNGKPGPLAQKLQARLRNYAGATS